MQTPAAVQKADVVPLDRTALLARALSPLSTVPRPFIRWAGSKQRLLTQIVPALPSQIRTYYEPFLGSGALFFLLQPQRAVLSDTCGELMATYRAIRDNAAAVLRYSMALNPLDPNQYYFVRAHRSVGQYKRAAEFLYLNRAGWNGLYRVNAQGKFNVPYGAPSSSHVVDRMNLLACSELLAAADIRLSTEDFEGACESARAGDLVFFDPPYVTRHNNNGFIDYNERLFGWDDQERLAQTAAGLASRGVHVLVTNAHHDEVLRLYEGFDVVTLSRHSTLAARAASRTPVKEALLVRVAQRASA